MSATDENGWPTEYVGVGSVPEWDSCDWCLRGSCSGAPLYPKCGGPSGPGIDEPEEY